MVVVHLYLLIALQVVFLLFLQLGAKVLPSAFAARKLCHAGSGMLMLGLDSNDVQARVFVYAVVATSLCMTWKCLPRWAPLQSFRFGADYDKGISIYLVIVALWFAAQQPSSALAPLFFADPAGAVVGKWCSKQGLNRVWWQNKTVAGTLAVFIFAYASLDVPSTPLPSPRFLVALACALGEAFGGQTYDNAVIALPAIGSYLFYHGLR
jgi:hypothetical protein